ncbi:MAG: protein phosphatase 2C domain-containing protein [Armatimonadota bacterium]
MAVETRIVVSCASHKGSKEVNEDGYLALAGESAPCGTIGLLAVADGIGGRATGAQASELALKTLAEVFSAGCIVANKSVSDVPHLLRFALQKANAAVFRAQTEDESLKGMGTTCVAVALTDREVHIVSVGDSRAYIYRQNELIPLTKDEWLKQPNGVTLVNHAVGWQPLLPVEPSSIEAQSGDLLLLCTDGLTDVIPEEVILEVLASYDDQTCTLLTDAAALYPNSDNVTVVIARIGS